MQRPPSSDRGDAAGTTGSASLADARRFFDEYLTPREGTELLPALSSLTTSFAIDVVRVRGSAESLSFLVIVERGVLVLCREIDPSSGDAERTGCRGRVAAENLLRVARGEATPQSLFVGGRLRIAGNPLPVLRAAPAMEELFRRQPYSVARAAS